MTEDGTVNKSLGEVSSVDTTQRRHSIHILCFRSDVQR